MIPVGVRLLSGTRSSLGQVEEEREVERRHSWLCSASP
ncbi:mCG148467 [Mus musculus]|nr:mCG148467 [Mus musculus]